MPIGRSTLLVTPLVDSTSTLFIFPPSPINTGICEFDYFFYNSVIICNSASVSQDQL